jgi:hypothetical protein
MDLVGILLYHQMHANSIVVIRDILSALELTIQDLYPSIHSLIVKDAHFTLLMRIFLHVNPLLLCVRMSTRRFLFSQ